MTKAVARHRSGLAIAAGFLSAQMFGLEISSVPVTLPALGAALKGEFTDLQWVMNAYTIASVTVMIAAGVLADRYGRRRMFTLAVAGFGLSSLLCGLAPSIGSLVSGRALQGLSGGAMMICSLAILSHRFRDGRERARAFGIWGIGLGSGLGFGPIIGGVLIAMAGWRWVFLIHAFIAIVTVVLALLGVPESRDPEPGQLDVAGVCTLSVALLALVVYITQGPTMGYRSAPGLTVLGTAALCLVAFVVAERRTAEPMFPLSLFAIRPFSGALLGAVGMNFSFWPVIVYLPVYLGRGPGYGIALSSTVLLAYTLPTFVLPPVAEQLALRFGAARMIPVSIVLIGAGLGLLCVATIVAEPTWATLLPGLLVAAVGLGLANTPVTNTTTGSVPPARSGMASAIDMTARLTFLAVNVAVMGTLFAAGIADSLRQRFPGLSADRLSDLAQRVINGDVLAAQGNTVEADHVVTAAVTHGFSLVVLYGAISAVILAIGSRAVFGGSPARGSVAQPWSHGSGGEAGGGNQTDGQGEGAVAQGGNHNDSCDRPQTDEDQQCDRHGAAHGDSLL